MRRMLVMAVTREGLDRSRDEDQINIKGRQAGSRRPRRPGHDRTRVLVLWQCSRRLAARGSALRNSRIREPPTMRNAATRAPTHAQSSSKRAITGDDPIGVPVRGGIHLRQYVLLFAAVTDEPREAGHFTTIRMRRWTRSTAGSPARDIASNRPKPSKFLSIFSGSRE